jgi:membrane protein
MAHAQVATRATVSTADDKRSEKRRGGFLETVRSSLPAKTIKAYGASKVGNFGAGLAFNAFLTMFPLVLGILSIIGLVIHDPGMQEKFQSALVGVFPADAHAELLSALGGVKQHAGLLGLVSVIGLIWSGTGLFASMEFALTQIFGTTQRDMLRQRLMGLIMMIIFLFAVVVAVAANNAATFLPFMPYTGFLIGTIAMVGLLIAIYRFVPNRTFGLKDVWPGAVLAGILLEVLTLAFPIYSKVAHGFNSYGQQFALFFLLATWLYFFSQILLLGAVFNRVRVIREPQARGLAATEPGRGEAPPRPVDAIKQQQERDESPEGLGSGDARSSGVPFPIALGLGLVASFAGVLVGRSQAKAR